MELDQEFFRDFMPKLFKIDLWTVQEFRNMKSKWANKFEWKKLYEQFMNIFVYEQFLNYS